MRGFIEFPPLAVFGPGFGMPRPPFGPFGGPDFHGGCPGHRRPGFGPFGHGEKTEHRGHQRCDRPEGERRGCCSSDSDEEECCCGPRDRRGPGGRPDFMRPGPFGPRPHYPGHPCFRRRGPYEFSERPWGGPWSRPWRGPWGSDHPHPWANQHRPCPLSFGHRRPCPYDRPESERRRSKRDDCEKCRENEPCCSGNKERRGCGRGGKENGPCNDKDKDQNTVFVQRIVLEKSARPQSV